MGVGIVTDDVIAEMVDRIAREVQPEQVYLFGSWARGDARKDSDVDILVVEREDFGPNRSRLHEINRISRALSSLRIPTDILLYSSGEYAKWRDSINHIVGHCEREGRLLYGRR